MLLREREQNIEFVKVCVCERVSENERERGVCVSGHSGLCVREERG